VPPETAGLRKPGPFEYVGDRLTADEVDAIEETRTDFERLHAALLRRLPEGRERALALTNLELAGMLSVKAITHVPRAEVAS
jgi:hypothetical protein